MVEEYADLLAARRLLPEGSRVRGQVAYVPQPGVIGVFVSLPGGLKGFVDVRLLPHDGNAWPAVGVTTEFEVLQHRPRQVRLWPLDRRWRGTWARGSAKAWNEAKKRHPVGSVTSATVTGVFPANQEYVIRFSDDKDDQPWSGATLSWVGDPPGIGTTAQYRITAHLDTTQRIMGTRHEPSS
jgi:ribosomal protein S1